MWKEFKEFAIKGNAIDLAVGVIIGAAFGGIINSLVKDILMPPVGLLTGGLDFSNQFMVLKAGKPGVPLTTPAQAATAGAVTWNYGNFVTLVINFIIVAFCIFLVVKAMNKLKRPSPTAAPVSIARASAFESHITAPSCSRMKSSLTRISAFGCSAGSTAIS